MSIIFDYWTAIDRENCWSSDPLTFGVQNKEKLFLKILTHHGLFQILDLMKPLG